MSDFHRHMAQATEADNADALARPDVPVVQR